MRLAREEGVRQFFYSALAVAVLVSSASMGEAREFKKIRKNESVGAQTMNGDSKLVNKGKINGNGDAGVTATGNGPKEIVNKGTISGSTGIKVTGGGSVTITNTGTITGGVTISGSP